jgi:hypothetical protein
MQQGCYGGSAGKSMKALSGQWCRLKESTYTGVILKDFSPEGSRAHAVSPLAASRFLAEKPASE